MLKDTKYCNCSISPNKLILKSNINHSFCNKCGSILIKTSNNNIYYTLKQKQKQKETEFNPIEIIKSMKKKTEEEYPYLNNEYNMSDLEKYNKEKIVQSINLYSKHRKNIILTLQKMMKMLDYSDLIFYQCLFYIDTYLSHNMSEEFSEKKFYII
jgi:DNA-directed RNA polymerase subunit M/transcription elongation factor TFIIS